MGLRILFFADTHLGFDLSLNPRIQRRRRGHDFFANYRKALEPARMGLADAVIHGGDLLYRSRVPARLVDMALSPLKEVADKGVDIFIVPGNHERSQIPYKILCVHPNLHIFDRPRTFLLEKQGIKLALSGFPYCRDNVRNKFPAILEETGWKRFKALDVGNFLCVHHCFEGATCGPGNFMFRHQEDVIKPKDIPREFLAVFAGHIHRFQVLRKDLDGHRLPIYVYYPGSIERTSFAERKEKKGYLWFEFCPDKKNGPLLKSWRFVELPARPMIWMSIPVYGMNKLKLEEFLRDALNKLNPDSVVRLCWEGRLPEECLSVLRSASLRSLCPPRMNVGIGFDQKLSGLKRFDNAEIFDRFG
jgi:exonuclease SbcD